MNEQAYIAGILVSAVLFIVIFAIRLKQSGIRMTVLLTACLLSAVLAFILSRGNVYLFGGFMTRRRGFFSLNPYDYSALGTLLGITIGVSIAAKCHGIRLLRLLDLAAPAMLCALAAARFAEFTTDFGWGSLIFDPKFQFFPLCVTDMYGQYHLAVFLFEGLAALLILVSLPRKGADEGIVFVLTACRFLLSQIFLESLRAETLRIGFVRVQQVECCVFLLVLIICLLYRDRGALVQAAGALFLMVGICIFAEFALDKISVIPAPVVYILMCASLIFCGIVLRRLFSRRLAGRAA